MNADGTNETLEVIKRRRSVRSYLDRQIGDSELNAILEAAMYAPNAGDQAWHFTVVQDKRLLRKMNDAAKEGARLSGVPHLCELGSDDGFDCLYGAPTLVVVSAPAQFPIPLDADCAVATQNMLLAAESLGLASCWVYFPLLAFGSPQGSELAAELRLPEGNRPYAAAIFGYATTDTPAAAPRKRGLVTRV